MPGRLDIDRQRHGVECQSLCSAEVSRKIIKQLQVEAWARTPVPHTGNPVLDMMCGILFGQVSISNLFETFKSEHQSKFKRLVPVGLHEYATHCYCRRADIL